MGAEEALSGGWEEGSPTHESSTQGGGLAQSENLGITTVDGLAVGRADSSPGAAWAWGADGGQGGGAIPGMVGLGLVGRDPGGQGQGSLTLDTTVGIIGGNGTGKGVPGYGALLNSSGPLPAFASPGRRRPTTAGGIGMRSYINSSLKSWRDT